MKNLSEYDEKRFREISERAEKSNKYFYTDFLTPQESSLLLSLNFHNSSLFGGTEGCERVIARFGDSNSVYYEEDYPISCLKISLPKSGPKAELTHRDYLGSLMGLGIDRKTIGDIVCTDCCAYVFVCDRISAFILSELSTVGKYNISCEISEIPENTVLFNEKEAEVNIASYRCDCIVSAVYNMSRTKAEAFFSAEQVFVNGRIASKSDMLKIGDTVSVRHKGKFRIIEESGYSKKGRIFIKVCVYM